MHMFTLGNWFTFTSVEKYQATDLDLAWTCEIESLLSSRLFDELGVIFGCEMQTRKHAGFNVHCCATRLLVSIK